MGISVFPRSILRKILVAVAGVVALAWICVPAALAQHVGGHFSGGARVPLPAARVPSPRVVVVPPPRAAISRPQAFVGPHLMRTNSPISSFVFGFRRHPIFVFRHPRFFVAPFFRFDEGLWFQSYAWLTCSPSWNWGCNGLPLDENGAENYVTRPAYENPPVYWYGTESRDLVQLYFKNGDVYSVSDYWFVDGQLHFTLDDEVDAKASEQVIDFDELDLQRTIAVNTRRGFRLVMRDEPWQQYLRDHPDATPPPLEAPVPKN
jgi:hypothetical protein